MVINYDSNYINGISRLAESHCNVFHCIHLTTHNPHNSQIVKHDANTNNTFQLSQKSLNLPVSEMGQPLP